MTSARPGASDAVGRYISPRPGDLAPEQAAVYAAIAEGPRKTQAGLVPVVDDEGRLLGPFGVMAIAPALGEAVQAVGAALRFHGRLAPATRELATLMVAVEHACDFEWFAHVNAARSAGLTPEQLAAVRDRQQPQGLDAEQAAVWAALRALQQRGALDDDEYAAATASLGEAGLAELVWLDGYYSMLATALAAFDPVLPGEARGVLTSRGPRG